MAEVEARKKRKSREGDKRPISRPTFHQKLEINSLQAQRVMDRNFDRVAKALFSTDVILRIIGDRDEVNEVEEIIRNQIEKASDDIMESSNQLKKLMKDNGIEDIPGYSAPTSYSIEITSPQIAQYAHLIRSLDNLMILVDTLWLNSVLTGKQRSDATYQWQQRLLNLASKIIGMERRARNSARNKGKEKEVEREAPKQDEQEDDTENES
ncbi:hypothetical protein [Marinomonas algarum]|uniref:DUF1845 domain-containing protein n=1 Tax=Marinomonas algarum TaxID=2883105 RepID=A0A9X1LFG8_9GAMM|nr:hypothetical protein [Marinomonas algarum]MCB5162957.1 hypothetical protein [Marinomonas algarum]